MSWKPEIEGIEARRSAAAGHGGEEAVARQHGLGRGTVRERVAELVDPASFREQGPIAGHSERDDDGRLERFVAANYVLGVAAIDGRPCVVGGEDFTQRGGSPSPSGLRKSVYAEQLALELRMPLIRLLEGGGGSVTGSRPRGAPAGDPVYTPHRFESIARVLERVPVVSAALGPVAGFPAARLAASHLAVMVRGTSQVMVAGPALVERALGRRPAKEALGGADVHLRSGVVDLAAPSEAEALGLVRRFLGYLPRHTGELPPRAVGDDPRDRCDERLLQIVPRDRRRAFDVRGVVTRIVDQGSFFEWGHDYGRGQVVGLARMEGRPIGLWANDGRFYAGAMTSAGARKVRRLVELCEQFHLPVVALVDEPGFMLGEAAEREGTIRDGMEAMLAVMRSSIPWLSIQIRKGFGVAAAAHFAPGARVLAWPSAESGALPVEGGVAVAFRREIEAAADPEARRHELEEALAARRDPFARAEAFGVHDLIDPRRTRPEICTWLDWMAPCLEEHRQAAWIPGR